MSLPNVAKSWDVERYEAGYSFVWSYGSKVVDLLDPKPGERILDLGCGTGRLTAEIASRDAKVIGLDSSPEMIAQSRINYPDLEFMLADGAHFSLPDPLDAVFSNATLHWIPDRRGVVACVCRALRPGGRFVAEFGARGNVRAILRAVAEVLGHDTNPWYFPSLGEYATLLESEGFRVNQAVQFDRLTQLETGHGMEDWLEMFGDALFKGLDRSSRREAAAEVVDACIPNCAATVYGTPTIDGFELLPFVSSEPVSDFTDCTDSRFDAVVLA